VHTLNNAAVVAVALLWGRDFMGAVGIAVGAGRDTDSTAATVGSVWGAVHGDAAIPPQLGGTHSRVRSAIRDFDGVTIDELAERALQLVDSDATRSER
jgi:ADP-ribosylglycohydrolase